MKVKTINLPDSKLFTLFSYLARIFLITSNSEILTLFSIYKLNNGHSITLTPSNRSFIRKEMSLSEAALNVALHRLEKKKFITRSGAKGGGTIAFHPVFADLDKVDGIFIRIPKEEVLE